MRAALHIKLDSQRLRMNGGLLRVIPSLHCEPESTTGKAVLKNKKKMRKEKKEKGEAPARDLGSPVLSNEKAKGMYTTPLHRNAVWKGVYLVGRCREVTTVGGK